MSSPAALTIRVKATWSESFFDLNDHFRARYLFTLSCRHCYPSRTSTAAHSDPGASSCSSFSTAPPLGEEPAHGHACTTRAFRTLASNEWADSFRYYGLWMWFPELFKRMEDGGSPCSNSSLPSLMTRNQSCYPVKTAGVLRFFPCLCDRIHSVFQSGATDCPHVMFLAPNSLHGRLPDCRFKPTRKHLHHPCDGQNRRKTSALWVWCLFLHVTKELCRFVHVERRNWPPLSVPTRLMHIMTLSRLVFVPSWQPGGVQSQRLLHLYGPDQSPESGPLLCLQLRECDHLELCGRAGDGALPDAATVPKQNWRVDVVVLL